MKKPLDVYLNHAGLICSLGSGTSDVAENLFFSKPTKSFVKKSKNYVISRELPVGEITALLAEVFIPQEDTRNNRVLTTAIEQLRPKIEELKQRFGAQRIGVVIGTSTSGISDGETALAYHRQHGQLPGDYHYRKQEISSPSRYVANWLGLKGPAFSVSSACTSGAKALASGARLIRLGVCDAVIAGGVDTLCRMTVEGFSSLSVTTDSICNPFSVNRNGINIGEAAGIFIMSAEPAAVCLAGWGESSDAYHISSPHPDGIGAESAMRKALSGAGLPASAIDYLNFHGTATEQNDRMEANAVHRVLGADICCGSTKPLTGHTLAAAGAIEAVFCWLALQRDDGLLPQHRWDAQYDSSLPPLNNIAAAKADRPLTAAMSNSFAFGGNNISLVMAKQS
jgi:3-oxoacyl-[acyl-carrier-protein] synthase-1